MNCSRLISDDEIKQLCAEVGASASGVAAAGDVDSRVAERLERWVAGGFHAGMVWMERHVALRRSTHSVLPEARSIIVAAFNYRPAVERNASLPRFAAYAYGEDYHAVVRRRLSVVADEMTARWGGHHRVCVDTAPLSERYWAQRAGIGFQGRNGLLYVPGAGSYVVIGEILTTLEIASSQPCFLKCPEGCEKCVDACPGKALTGDGHLDARRCLSYLTIEHKGALPADIRLCGQVYGCDMCQRVCPLNSGGETTRIAEFAPSDQFMSLTLSDILNLDNERFRAIFGRSAVRRAGLTGLHRNAVMLAEMLSNRLK